MTLDPKALSAAAQAIALDDLTQHGRDTFDWEKDFAAAERAKYRTEAHGAIQAYLEHPAVDLVPRSELASMTDKLNDWARIAKEESDQRDNIMVGLDSMTDDRDGWRRRAQKRTDERDEALQQLAALREALEFVVADAEAYFKRSSHDRCPWESIHKIAPAVLTDTASAAAQYQLVDDEHVVVPVEPTKAMAEAWAKLSLERIRKAVESDERRPVVGMVEGAKESYKAMTAAAKAGEPEGE